jgi:rhomboid protease GluP
MDQFFRLVVYIIAANVAYLIYSLLKQGYKHYLNYIIELLCLDIIILWTLYLNISAGWVLLGAVIGIVVLVILPVFLQGKIDSLMAESRYDEILFFARLKAAIAWSEPNLHLQEMAEIAEKYAETPVKMVDNLKTLLNKGEPYDGMTRLFLGLIHFNNRNFNDLINDLKIPDKPFEEQSFEELLYLVRAYLETTRYDEAVEAQIALENKINENSDSKEERKNNAIINRFVFYAFMGWKEEYDDFLNSGEDGLDRLPKELRDYWRGVCYFYSGEYDEGEKMMRAVIDSLPEEALFFKEFMQKRMFGMFEHKVFFNEHVLPKLKELHEKYSKKLSEVIEENNSPEFVVPLQNRVTNVLAFIILCISVIFIVAFNVNDSIELINMGAASSFLVNNGEYFRLVSYIFVHVGILHLMMNLLALKYFGPPVETIAGWPGLLFIFFGSGIAGGALSVFMGNSLTVGASGGVLGLLTASIIFELFKVKGAGNFHEQSNISTLIFILAINIGFGFFENGIDNYAHFGGLLGGAILGMIYAIFIKISLLKKVAGFASIAVVIATLGLAFNQHISLFRSNSFYPEKTKGFKRCEVASSTLSLEIPETWTLDESSAKLQELNAKGPFGEKLNVIFGLNTESEEAFIKEYVEQKNREFEQENEIELVSIIGPEPVSFRNNTYRVVWNIKAYGRTAALENHIVFEDGLVFITNLIVTTSHTENYSSISKQAVTSLKLKETL